MKNDILTLEITGADIEGAGIARAPDGRVVFVQRGFTGDVVSAKIIKEHSSYLIARIESLISPSPLRIEPDCEAYVRHCGGCSFRHISYEAEKALKLDYVRSSLRLASGCTLPEKINTAGESRYRNKAAYPVDAELNFGYYATRSHRVVPHCDCLLEPPEFSEIARAVCRHCRTLGISGYDEQSGKGVLRHIFLRRNRKGEVLLVTVISRDTLPHGKELAGLLMSEIPQIRGICVNVNKDNTNVIMGATTYTLAGCDSLEETIRGRRFRIAPKSFFQVNSDGCELLYGIAAEFAGAGKGRTILDLYCGIGTIGLCIAGEGDRLCGAEIVEEAIGDARINAGLCGRCESDTVFVCGDAATGVSACKKRFGTPDVIIADPPRKGLSDEVISGIVNSGTNSLVYVSCNPATLARDITLLDSGGFCPVRAECVDMFPRTSHVETVVLMSKVLNNLK